MKRLFIVMVLVLCMLPPSEGMAQPASLDATSMTSGLTGEVIDLGTGEWIRFDPTLYSLYQSPDYSEEFITILSYWSTYMIGFVKGVAGADVYTAEIQSALARDYEGFAIRAEGQDETGFWFVADVQWDGYPYLLYYEYVPAAFDEYDFVFIQYVAETYLATDFAHVQQQVTIGGQTLLPGTDPDVVQQRASGEAGPVEEGAGTSEAGVDNDIFAQLLSVDTGSDGGSVSNVWKARGLVSESEWVSPMWGTQVQWDTARWQFAYDHPWAYFRVDDLGYDGITLHNQDDTALVHVYVNRPAGNFTPQDYLDYWLSPEYAELFQRLDVISTATSGNTVSLIAETDDEMSGTRMMVMTGTFLPNGEFIQVQVFASPELIGAAYEQFHGSLTVNNAPLDLTWTVEEVRARLPD